MTEIVIVWNNDITPQKAGIIPNQNWKRPVRFMPTPRNSMDYRYMLPPESKSKVFFSMDDDIIITCQQLQRGFQQWQNYAVGDIGPLLSYDYRTYDFKSKTNEFSYTFLLEKTTFYSFVLTGFSWISRFYLDLYYVEENKMLQSLREIVRQKNNCDDILLNYVVTYFFPEMIPRKIKQHNLDMDLLPKSQSRTRNHYKFRSFCIKEFSTIIGYNPLRMIHNETVSRANIQFSPLNKYITFLRKKELQSLYFSKNGSIIPKLIQKEKVLDDKINEQIAVKLKHKQLINDLSLLQKQNIELQKQNQQLKSLDERMGTQVCQGQLQFKEEEIQKMETKINNVLKVSFGISALLVFSIMILVFNIYNMKKDLSNKNDFDSANEGNQFEYSERSQINSMR